MPETYKLSAIDVRPRRPWQGQKGGSFISYYVSVEGDQRTFEIAQKVDTPIPTVGQELEANVETREHNGTTYYQLKKVQQQGGWGGQKADPKKDARITRMAAQERAIRYMVAKGITDFKLNDDFRKVVKWFADDANAAGDKA